MGISDVFGKEDRAEITISQLITFCENNARLKAENNIMLTGYKKGIKHETVLILLDKESEDK